MADDAYSDRMAARYDADFHAVFGGPSRGDVAFFTGVARMCSGPIAEIGSGTGRVIAAIAEAHPERPCVGVEPSAAMRAVAFERGTRVVHMDGSFTAIPLPDASQGYVFAAFRSFQHVLDADAQLAALIELRRVLLPGGVLALDFFDPDFARLQSTGWVRNACYASGRGTRIERWLQQSVERASQVMTVRFRWIERFGERLVGVDDAAYRVRYTFRWELWHLVQRAGFREVELFGDYERGPIGEDARELVLLAKR